MLFNCLKVIDQRFRKKVHLQIFTAKLMEKLKGKTILVVKAMVPVLVSDVTSFESDDDT